MENVFSACNEGEPPKGRQVVCISELADFTQMGSAIIIPEKNYSRNKSVDM